MYGWHLKILRVNLTTKKVTQEDVDPKIARDYLGGRGWAIHYLYKEMDPMADPLSPENKLIFATGPLTATPAPTGNRYMVVTKSPLTGALAHSNSGGEFPTWMKRTGFDMYIFEGKSSEPVYLFVNEDQIEVRSAAHVWGKDTHETTDILKAETSADARVACIGPAGENLALMAAIMNDKHRAAARSGVGAVMGSKNLKAVVAMGNKNPPLFDPEGMRALSVDTSKNVGADVKKGSNMRIYGTSYVPQVTNTLGILPTRNFLQGTFEHVNNIDGDALKNQYLIRHTPCYRCPLSCGRLTEVPDGKYKGKGEGPEYETISSLGTGCGVSDLAALLKANYLCNEYGMDTITTGMTIAAAMEMYEKGYISEEIIGMPLKFGDHDAMIAMIKLMAYREGFGNDLAMGSYRLAEKYGHPEIAVTTRKQEFPGYDPRGSQGMGLLYATSNKGASHMEGDVAYEEVFGVPVKENPLTTEGKPELVKHFEDSFALMDSSGLCVFVAIRYAFNKDRMILPERLAEMMNLSTGANYTPQEALKAAERVYNLERMFLLKAGSTEDTLPHRMLHEPLPDGPAKGMVVELDKMLPEFYKLRGWDEKGVPTKEKLEELGLPLN
ncbi:aldehyde ferredoxin oxidoreductase family protein [Candidatus Villigracilis saccharophilus]|uniref:aldehyde ferredoxin oxidoreductase family protein n=1 Tax=Candidatus Villigracilis saccharophilus TaxID=3140684 RepID=UPI0031364140|nr:aldehyde ferredoxin oxidoreductase family protein [Anaerolineales bacterium]